MAADKKTYLNRVHAMRQSIACARLEGMEPAPGFEKDSLTWAQGRISANELVARRLAHWKTGNQP